MSSALEIARQFLAARAGEKGGKGANRIEPTVPVGFLPFYPFSPTDLSDDFRATWEERAAILEFDGGLARHRAEALARLDLQDSMARASTGSSDRPSGADRASSDTA